MNNVIIEFAEWFSMECDGDWEHGEGITIESLDNPGWSLRICLDGTLLADKAFNPIMKGDSEDFNDTTWLNCYKEGEFFYAYGGRDMLEEIIRIFIEWMKSNTDPSPWNDEVERLKSKCLELRSDIKKGIIREPDIRLVNSEINNIPQEHPEKRFLRRMFEEIYQ